MAVDPFIGEISMVAFARAPQGWAFCDGSILSISQYSALYSLIGHLFGGDGISTFALPDLRGRAPLGMGQGPNLAPVSLAQYLGAEKCFVGRDNLPPHTHDATFTSAGVRPTGYSGGGSLTNPSGAVLANPVSDGGVTLAAFAPASEANAGLAPLPVQGQVAVASTGAGAPIDIRNPALGINYIIALEGVYPQWG